MQQCWCWHQRQSPCTQRRHVMASQASSVSDFYKPRSCFQRLDHYFWPFSATNRLSDAVFTHWFLLFLYRVVALAAVVYVLYYTWLAQRTRSFAYTEVWGALLTCGLYILLLLNYCCKCLWKYTHFLYELTWCVELGFTAVFWAFLYPQGEREGLVLDVVMHGGVLGVVVLDYFNNAIYFYRRHLRAILLIALIYIIVNVPIALTVFSAHRHLNYQDAWTALGIVMEFVFMVLAFLVGALLDKYKYRFMQKPIDDPLLDFDDSTVYHSDSSDAKSRDLP